MINHVDKVKCKATKMEDFLELDQVIEAIQVQICYRLKIIVEQRAASDATNKDFVNSLKALDIIKVS